MAKKIYDPDIIDRPSTVGENSNTQKEEPSRHDRKENSAAADTTPGLASRVVAFCRSRRTQIFTGALLGLFGVYLLIIFISYLQNGAADQSLIMSHSVSQLASGEEKVGNAGASVGASMADAFIYRGVGLAAFIIAVWCIVIGIRMIKPATKVHFFHFTLMSLVNIIACVMVLGAIALYVNPFFFPMGGNLGHYCNLLLLDFTGVPGMILTNILIVVLWAMVCYKTLRLIYSTVNKYIPRRTKLEEAEEEDDDDNDGENNESREMSDINGSDNSAATGTQQNDPFQPEEIDITPTVEEQETDTPYDEDVPLEIPTEKYEHKVLENDTSDAGATTPVNLTDKSRRTDESGIEGTITVSAPIEQGSEKRFEAYDPTKELSKYKMPPLDLLREGTRQHNTTDFEEQEANKKRITETLAHYDIQIKKIDVCADSRQVYRRYRSTKQRPADGIHAVDSGFGQIPELQDGIANGAWLHNHQRRGCGRPCKNAAPARSRCHRTG